MDRLEAAGIRDGQRDGMCQASAEGAVHPQQGAGSDFAEHFPSLGCAAPFGQ